MSKWKRKRKEDGGSCTLMESIVWQVPANPPQPRDHIFRDGRRYVKPYHFEFLSHAKGRWEGKNLVDLTCLPVNAVKSGRIQVDGQNVPVSYIVKSSQKISHFVHRHEPPVMDLDVSILEKEPDVLTVCRSASVPVHPCGQYRKKHCGWNLRSRAWLGPFIPYPK